MGHRKTFICLANSRKLSGRCVAGIVTEGNFAGAWVRPVSARTTHEISEEERRYQNGSSPQIFDVVEVEFLNAAPIGHQTENDLIDPKYYWEKKGVIEWEAAANLSENPASLWTNGDSTYSGRNDRVSEQLAKKQAKSLYLIRVPSVSIKVSAEGAAFGNNKKKVRATSLLKKQLIR